MIPGTRRAFKDADGNYFLVAGPLIGIILGGLISSFAKYVELRFQWKFERRRIKIGVFESLYASVNRLQIETSLLQADLVKLHLRERDPRARAAELTELVWKPFSESIVPIEAVITIHVKRLVPLVSELSSEYLRWFESALEYVKGDDSANHKAMIGEAYDPLFEKFQQLLGAIVDESEATEQSPIHFGW